ncbi:MAG: iron-sulfur cluster repair di-iron protein [Ferruginibacter sp.]
MVTLQSESIDQILNVTILEPNLKHPTIISMFNALKAGESMQIINDHDPKPLYYQMKAERGNIFTWTYNEKGPQHWIVTIVKCAIVNRESIGEIVAKDFRKTDVFKKYGIDFCCGGKKLLSEACKENGLDESIIMAELNNVKVVDRPSNDFNNWSPAFLADYIYYQHHLYFYRENPVIKEVLAKVIARHVRDFPTLKELGDAYKYLETELNLHFAKEEKEVFPFIKLLSEAQSTGNTKALSEFPSLTEPLQLREIDHDEAGVLLLHIRKLTNDFNAPEEACNSFKYLYKKLEELESDLHKHIHLENNILFPAAIRLEKEITSIL